MSDFIQKTKFSLTNLRDGNIRQLFFLLILLIGLPVAIFAALQQQELRQHASPNGAVEFSSTPVGGSLITMTQDPELYLKVTLPDRWQLAGEKTDRRFAKEQDISFVQEVHAQSTCNQQPLAGCTGGDVYCWCLGCHQQGPNCVFENFSTTSGSDWSCVSAPMCTNGATQYVSRDCSTTTNCAVPPTATHIPIPTFPQNPPTSTPVPAQNLNTNTPINSTGCDISPRKVQTTNPGMVQMTISFTSAPGIGTRILVNAASNDGIGKRNLNEISSWTQIADKTIDGNNIQESVPLYLDGKGFTEGEHLTRVQVIRNGAVVVDGQCGAIGFETASQPTQPPTSLQAIKIYQIHIQNIDPGSGGHEPVRITGDANLVSFFSNPYWKLNPQGPNPKRVQVDFYDFDAAQHLDNPSIGHHVMAIGEITYIPPSSTYAAPSPVPSAVTPAQPAEAGQCIGSSGSFSFTCGGSGIPNNSLSLSWHLPEVYGADTCNIYVRGGPKDYHISNSCNGSRQIVGNLDGDAITNDGIYQLWISNGNRDGSQACYNFMAKEIRLNCTTPATPTSTQFLACIKKPSEVGTNIIPSMSFDQLDRIYQWVEVGTIGKPEQGQPVNTCNNDTSFCVPTPKRNNDDTTQHDQCPKNESQPAFIDPRTSNWCYNSHCLQLRYIGQDALPPATPSPTGATQTPTPTTKPPTTPTPTPTTPVLKPDANGDGKVDMQDFNLWKDEYLEKVTTKLADFDKDGKVDLKDYNIWRNYGYTP